MTTAEFIRYYHGTILGSVNNVYLVHYGDAAEVWCGIGCWVRDTEKDREYASFHSDDIANPFWADLIERLHAHPETITDYIGSGHSPHDIPIRWMKQIFRFCWKKSGRRMQNGRG